MAPRVAAWPRTAHRADAAGWRTPRSARRGNPTAAAARPNRRSASEWPSAIATGVSFIRSSRRRSRRCSAPLVRYLSSTRPRRSRHATPARSSPSPRVFGLRPIAETRSRSSIAPPRRDARCSLAVLLDPARGRAPHRAGCPARPSPRPAPRAGRRRSRAAGSAARKIRSTSAPSPAKMPANSIAM